MCDHLCGNGTWKKDQLARKWVGEAQEVPKVSGTLHDAERRDPSIGAQDGHERKSSGKGSRG